MIASRRHRFVYVKTRKTAGTSIELSLSAVCGDADIITPLGPRDEPVRTAAGTRGPQHYRRGETGGPRRLLGRSSAAWNHMPATEIIKLIGRPAWDSYFTFAVERNPWDRAVSLYHFRASKQSDLPPFGAFLRGADTQVLSNFALYSDHGQPIVDRVVRYESLADELADIWQRLEILPPQLGHAKAGLRPARDYRADYTDADAAFVAEVCAREIALLGYSFDRDAPS